MEVPTLPPLESLRRHGFQYLPPEMKVRVFNVDYLVVREPDGGTLYVTEAGWPLLDAIQPACWHRDGQILRGIRVPGATGTVYRVHSIPPPGSTLLRKGVDLLVKYSRFGQEVPVWVDPAARGRIVSDHDIAHARFLGPFEEFELAMELRHGYFGPQDLRVLTKRPLAIYEPPTENQLWETGRKMSRVREAMLLQDQQTLRRRQAGHDVTLNVLHDYVMVYHWVKGENATVMFDRGLIEPGEFHQLVPEAVRLLESKGFRMLDIKPPHLIMRQRPDGTLMRRHGKPVSVLIDYELLVRTPEYQAMHNQMLRIMGLGVNR